MINYDSKKKLCVIIKTHNDFTVLGKCIDSLERQNFSDFDIIIMDTASDDISYVEKYMENSRIKVLVDKRDLGFCVGNNIATQDVINRYKYIMYLNPDAFLHKNFIDQSIRFLENDIAGEIGLLTGKLLWFDLKNNMETNIIDSAGIFQTWYGRWYNRGMGEVDIGQYDTPVGGVDVPAACGALMFCRSDTLHSIELSPGEYFNASFYMYKDDIDLSIRIRKAGYKIVYNSHFLAWHCRGWQRKNRQSMPKKLRLHAAKNEVYINKQMSLFKYLYSLVKLVFVRLGF